MPWAAPRTCRSAGCPGYAYGHDTHGWCANCWERERPAYEEREAKRRAHHGPSYGRNTKRWQATRRGHLADHPLCAYCGELATQVHHKVALKDGGDLLDEHNLESLCSRCHARVEASERNSNAGIGSAARQGASLGTFPARHSKGPRQGVDHGKSTTTQGDDHLPAVS